MALEPTGYLNNKNALTAKGKRNLAGETRFEHATYGFGDRYSTVEPLPYILILFYTKIACMSNVFQAKSK